MKAVSKEHIQVMFAETTGHHVRLISTLLRTGELAWTPQDEEETYGAILDLEDAGLLSAPLIEAAGQYKWRGTAKSRVWDEYRLATPKSEGGPAWTAPTATHTQRLSSHKVGARCEALAAVARSLGTPLGREAFDRHADALQVAFGPGLVRDIDRVLATQDREAARRIWDRLCPGISFTVVDLGHTMKVSYRSGCHSGSYTVETDPYFQLSEAVALAGAALEAHGETSGWVAADTMAFEPVRLAA